MGRNGRENILWLPRYKLVVSLLIKGNANKMPCGIFVGVCYVPMCAYVHVYEYVHVCVSVCARTRMSMCEYEQLHSRLW